MELLEGHPVSGGLGLLSSIVILALFGCVPALLSLVTCRNRVLRAREKGVPPGWPMQGMIFSAAAFLLNLALLSVSAILLSRSGDWTRLQAAMLLIGWICFWLWIIVLLTTRARSRRAVY